MERVNVLQCIAIALLVMYGWIPICWCIGKALGWL